MAEAIFNLGVAIFVALLGSVIALRLKLHPIAGLLFLGFVAGPGVLEIIEKDELTIFIAEIGAILLLFRIGLEVKVESMLKKGLRAVIIGVLKLAFVFAIVYEIALLMGFGLQESLLLGSMLAITSTAVFAVLSKNMNIDRNLFLTILLLEDIFAILVLSAIPELAGEVTLTGLERFVSFMLSILALIIGYFVVRKIITFALPFFVQSGDRNSLLFTSLALCFILSFAVQSIGLDAAIGAFIAGNIMASVRSEPEIHNTIKPFAAVFSSFFFLSIGMEIQLDSLISNPIPIILFTLVSIVGKMAGIAGGAYLLGTGGIKAIETGFLMISTGEFSLLIAKDALEILGVDLISIVSAVVFLSTVASSLTINRSNALAIGIIKLIPPRAGFWFKQLSSYFSQVISEFESGGGLYRVFIKNTSEILTRILKLMIFFVPAFILLKINLEEPFDVILNIISTFLIAAGLLFEVPGIIKHSLQIIRGISQAFLLAHKRYEDLDRKMMTRSAALLICICGGVALTFLFSFLMLPEIFYYFVLFLYLLAVVFLIELLLTMREIVGMKFKRKVRRIERKK